MSPNNTRKYILFYGHDVSNWYGIPFEVDEFNVKSVVFKTNDAV